MAKAEFYVYVHRRADTGEVFYVGKGSGKRAYSKSGRTEYWNRVVQKHGYTVEIVAYCATETESFRHEKTLVALHRAVGRRLVNLTDGGEGACGRVHSEATKALLSAAHLGKKMSAEAVAKMSASRLGRKPSAEAIAKTAAANRGRKRSQEAIERTSAGLRGKHLTAEHKAALRKAWESRRLRPLSDATRAKMSIAQKTKPRRPHSEETKRKISAAKTGRQLTPEGRQKRLASLQRTAAIRI